MSDMEYWLEDKRINRWEMPHAPWWKRLPVIRHIRAIYYRAKVARHNAFWTSVGKIPTGYDSWVVYGIARGMERRIVADCREGARGYEIEERIGDAMKKLDE